MNTEKIKTLEQIHVAIEIVENARTIPGLSSEQKYELESASVILWNLEQAIIRKIGDDLITSLTTDSKALNDLAAKIKQSATSLAGVANAVEKAAKIVEALISIIVSATGAGLI